jgi:hypothetical protein
MDLGGSALISVGSGLRVDGDARRGRFRVGLFTVAGLLAGPRRRKYLDEKSSSSEEAGGEESSELEGDVARFIFGDEVVEVVGRAALAIAALNFEAMVVVRICVVVRWNAR